jgi:hypothetical protein
MSRDRPGPQLGPRPLGARRDRPYLGEMPRHAGVVSAALLLLALAAPAASAAPGDRAAGTSIRQATIDLHQAVLAQAPAIRAAQLQFRDDPVCANALKGVPDNQSDDLIIEFLLPALFEIEIGPIKAPLAAFSARLEQIPMRDATLKSGRAAWRVYTALFARFAPPPTDICARLDAWRQSGYAAASRPVIKDPIFQEAIRNDERDERLDAKLERSANRLRGLGVSKRVVGWWSGETLLDEVDPPDDLIPEGS